MDTKIAVVGCGYWGSKLARNFANLGALAGVVDESAQVAEAIARENGVAPFTLEAALADSAIHGVAIATPAETHKAVALKAFAAKKHVFVEKPIALSLDDGAAMDAAARRAGVKLMVGHLLLYHPAFESLRALVSGGELGALRYCYSHRLSLGRFRVEENALWSLAPHDISMLLALFGEEPIAVAGDGGAYVTSGVEDECRVDLKFSGGRRAHIFASWLHPFKEQRLVVIGERGMAVFEDSLKGPEKLRLYRHAVDTSGRVPTPVEGRVELVPFGSEEPLRNECQHFLACCQGSAPRSDATEALRVLKVLVAASRTAPR